MRRGWTFARAAGAVLGLAAMLAFAGPANAASIVDNGDFEEPVVPGSHEVFGAGQSFGAWTVAGGALLLGAPHTEDAPNGRQYVVFNRDLASGVGPATMQQDLSTTAGTRYHLRFAFAGDPSIAGQTGCGESDNIKPFGVIWGADPMVRHEFDTTGHGPGAFGWTYADTLVDATTATTPLRFQSLHEGNCGAALDDVSVDVPPASMTATSVSTTPASTVFGQPVELTATVIGAQPATTPTGSVQFERDGAPLGAPVTLDADGAAMLTITDSAPGHRAITADYEPGSAAFDPSLGRGGLTVEKADTTTTVTVAPNPAVAGQEATYSAVVEPQAPGAGGPTGTVRFVEDVSGQFIGAPVPLDDSGAARLTTSDPPGSYRVRAHYEGDSGFEPSYGAASLQVNRARTTTRIVSDVNPVAPGGDVTFIVTVSTVEPAGRAPTGSVTFTADGEAITEPIPLDPAGALKSDLAVTFEAPTEPGATTIGAHYGGDRDTEPSDDSLRQSVTALPGPTQPTAPPAANPAAATNPRSALGALVRALASTVKRRGGAALKARLSFQSLGAGKLELRVFGQKRAGSRGRAQPLLASGTRIFTSAGAASVRLRPTAAGRRALRRGERLPLRVVARFTPASGGPSTVTKRVTIRPKRKRRAGTAQGRTTGGGWRASS